MDEDEELVQRLAPVKVTWEVRQDQDEMLTVRVWSGTDTDRVYPDLTEDGWYAECDIREAVAGELWQKFTSDATSGPRIVLTEDGWVHVVLPAATTRDPSWNERGKAIYDVELTSPNERRRRIAEGPFKFFPDVTRDTP